MPPKKGQSKGKAAAAPRPDDDVLPQGIADMEIPKSTVTRIAKSTVPDETKMAKEVPLALVRASTVFISYLAALSQESAADKNVKTVNAQHVLEAVRELGWPEGEALQKYLKMQLKAYKANAAAKKAGKPLPHPKSMTESKPKAAPSVPQTSNASTSAVHEASDNATQGQAEAEDIEMGTASAPIQIRVEADEEEDIDEGEPPDDEAGEDEEEAADAFSEPEDEQEVEDTGLGDDVPRNENHDW